TVVALAEALEAKDPHTGRHAQRVQQYALTLTEAVDPTLLDDPGLEYGFLLHDIGKIAIPNHILEKPGPLNPAEWKVMQAHPKIGAEILSDVTLLEGHGVDVVRSHHERWDGTGYPDGLAGADIPLGARIFALADALDAMTTDRCYRPRRAHDAACRELRREAGCQFDPEVVEVLLDELRAIDPRGRARRRAHAQPDTRAQAAEEVVASL